MMITSVLPEMVASSPSLWQAMQTALPALDTSLPLQALAHPLLKAQHAAVATLRSSSSWVRPKEELWRFISQQGFFQKPWQVSNQVQVVLNAPHTFTVQGGTFFSLHTLENWQSLSSEMQVWVLQQLAQEHQTHVQLSEHDALWHLFTQSVGQAPYVLSLPSTLQGVHAIELEVSIPAEMAQDDALTVLPLRLFVLAQNAQAHVHVTCKVRVAGQVSSAPVLVHTIVQAMVSPRASVAWLNQCHSFHPALYWMTSTQATVEAEAQWSMLNVNTQVSWVRHGGLVTLKGERADTKLCGLSLGQMSQKIHHHVRIHHEAEHTTSQQAFKQVMQHQSYAEFSGSIQVHKVAQKTDAQQLSNSILLSDQAKVFVRPWLKIDADDVKCSHGATVGQLESDQLFYLASRGLSHAEASKLMLQGFVHEVIDTYLEGQHLPDEILSPLGSHLHTEVEVALESLVSEVSS
ncbi:MAG: SufD family Fe-S cluster assembly protein [Vampirovibrionales bacterium]